MTPDDSEDLRSYNVVILKVTGIVDSARLFNYLHTFLCLDWFFWFAVAREHECRVSLRLHIGMIFPSSVNTTVTRTGFPSLSRS